jgi:replicative DNA helicase
MESIQDWNNMLRQAIKESGDKKAERIMTFNRPLDLYNNFFHEVENTSMKDVIRTGISEIDNAIVGIFPTSLVVIGGETGEGKSLFAGNIAFEAIKQGKKVVYFDFENDNGDWFRRQLARELYKKGIKVRHADLRIKENFEKNSDVIAETAAILVDSLHDSLLIYNNIQVPTLDEFIHYLDLVDDSCDLVVIDHLHYFQFESDMSDTENIGKIMRRLRTLTRERNIPIILVSHLRKKQNAKGAPDNDDLFGSSNIAKEAETVLLLWRDKFSSHISLTKCRNTGIRKSWTYDRGGYNFKNIKEEQNDISNIEF